MMRSISDIRTDGPAPLSLRPLPLDHRIAALAALAVGIHALESALPSPVPGIKPGLANVVTIVALVMYGWRVAAWVAVLRVLASSLVLGTLLSPTFYLSCAGAAASLTALGLARTLPGRGFGPVGYGLLGALAHTTGQVTVAYLWLIPHPVILGLLPALLTAAAVFGLVTGRLAAALLPRLPPSGREEAS